MTGKGEKQKGDETQLQGKDVCVRGVCLCVSVRARARSRTLPCETRLPQQRASSKGAQ